MICKNKNEEYQMGLNYEVGDIVTLKKAHPCGSKEWEKNTRDLKKIEKN